MFRILLLIFFIFYFFSDTFSQIISWEKVNVDSIDYPNVKVSSIATNYFNDIFIGTSDDHIFRLLNSEQEWKLVQHGSLIDSITYYDVRSLAINSKGHVFACKSGDGLYKSEDNGVTWSMIGFEDYWLETINIHPSQRIYMSSVDPYILLGSRDNGGTWYSVRYNENDFHRYPTVSHIAFASNLKIYLIANNYLCLSINDSPFTIINRDIHYYSILITEKDYVFLGTNDGSIFRSIDGGVSFTKVGLPEISSRITSFTVNSKNEIFVGTNGDGIYFTEDEGINWIQINNGLRSNPKIYTFGLTSDDLIFVSTDSGLYKYTSITKVTNDKFNISSFDEIICQNYPNPFNSSTTFLLSVPYACNINIIINNQLGQFVDSIFLENKFGTISYTWNSKNTKGKSLSSSLYFYKVIINHKIVFRGKLSFLQ